MIKFNSWPRMGKSGALRTFIQLVLFWGSASLALGGSTYYVATNGASGNSGLTTNSPWPLSYALTTVAASNTIIVLPGTYTGQVIVRKSYTTLLSQQKWGARLVSAGNYAGVSVWPAPIDHVTIDGFEVADAGRHGIAIYGSNVTVRNCWVHDSGQSHNVNNGSGIFSALPYYNTVIEKNLLENNGYSLGYDHGIYVSGTNCVLRGNVCRGNLGFGISIYDDHGGASDNCQVYGNLLYNNYSGSNRPSDYQLGINNGNIPNTTNYVFGNSLMATNTKAVFLHSVTVCFTNNIIGSSGDGIDIYAPATAIGDYNYAPRPLLTQGAHDTINPSYGSLLISNALLWFEAPVSPDYWLGLKPPAAPQNLRIGP